MTGRTNEATWNGKHQYWKINVQKDGERRSFYSSVVGKKGKIAAEKKADKWLDSRTSDENIRLEKLWERFLAATLAQGYEAAYLKHRQHGEKWILPNLRHKKVKDISSQNWQDCINAAYQAGRSKKTCKNIRGSITSFCKYVKKCRIPIERPEDLTIPKEAPMKKKTILQPADIKILFSQDTIKRHNRQEKCFEIFAWRFLLVTGLRRAELCALRREDIENGILHVKGTKTEAADRYIALSKWMTSILDQQAENLKENGIISPYLFPAIDGQKMSPDHLGKTWKAYKTQHGIKSTLHELRHTLISVSKADMPGELLKLVVGHTAKTDTFGIYGHEFEGDLQRAANIFDSIFDKLLN